MVSKEHAIIELPLNITYGELWDHLEWLSDNVGYYIGTNPVAGKWYGSGWEVQTKHIPDSYTYTKPEYILILASPENATLYTLRWGIK